MLFIVQKAISCNFMHETMAFCVEISNFATHFFYHYTMKTALFTGTFDPFTIGHQSIVDRTINLFDRLIIAVAVSKLKHTDEQVEQRVRAIADIYRDEPRVVVKAYSDLTIDMAKREGAQYLIRGVRNVKDYEYERTQADFNRKFGSIETILVFAEPGLEHVSSTLVRELKSFGRDVTDFLPKKD